MLHRSCRSVADIFLHSQALEPLPYTSNIEEVDMARVHSQRQSNRIKTVSAVCKSGSIVARARGIP